MEFTIKSGSPEKQRSACVVVGVFDNRKLSLSAELSDRASNGYVSEIIRRGDMEGKLGATLLLHNVRGTLQSGVQMTSGFITLRREVMKHKFIIGRIAVGIVVVLMTINGVVKAQGLPNWNASPLNFDNSPLNFNNSPLNFNNSPMNWNNSPLNINSNDGIIR